MYVIKWSKEKIEKWLDSVLDLVRESFCNEMIRQNATYFKHQKLYQSLNYKGVKTDEFDQYLVLQYNA